MSNVFVEIKKSIIRLLKELDPLVDVFAEEIKKTKDMENEPDIKTYYFIDIVPLGNVTVDKYFTDRSVYIDIAYHNESEETETYIYKIIDLDDKFRPVFCFSDRSITINDATSKIVDKVLHYTFSFTFRDCREDTEQYEFMGELVNEVNKGA